MILDSFLMKLNQRAFNSQQIVHVNDLKMYTGQIPMKQSEYGPPKRIEQLLDFGAPNYYAEFVPHDTDQLRSHGSLCRISGFLHAASRVKTMQTISKIANFNQHVLYLDSQSLILKNQCLKDCITYLHMGQSVEQLGKWVLVAETPVAKKEPEKMRDVQLLKEHLTLIKRKPVNMPLNTAS